MNSRDAAYDEMEMMALLADSAAEAAAGAQSSPSPVNGSVNGLADVDEQAPGPATAKRKRKRGSEDAFVTLTVVLFPPVNPLLSVAHQSNAPDPRRRLRTVQLYPNPQMKTHQRRHPSPSRCPRPQCPLQRVADHAIDVEAVVVVDPPPRRKTGRRWMGMRVSNLIYPISDHPAHFRKQAAECHSGRATDAPGVDAQGQAAPGATQTQVKPLAAPTVHPPQYHQLPSPERIHLHNNSNSHC
jgi:hypothetical protein